MFGPLSTTFVHILRLNRLLSIRKLMVDGQFWDSGRGPRNVGVNQKENHKGLGLRSRCLRYSFATIFLAFCIVMRFPAENLRPQTLNLSTYSDISRRH